MTEFHYTACAQDIIFGPGAVGRLGEAIDRFGWRRLMLCAAGSARRGGRVAQIEAALGERLAATYERVQPHVQDFQVAEALDLAAEKEVDAVIGLGGGSPIGMAKAVSAALAEKHASKPAREGQAEVGAGLAPAHPSSLAPAHPSSQARVGQAQMGQMQMGQTQGAAPTPVVAIPTTYAGSEMTPVYGVTHTRENPPRKVTVNDPRIAPKLVIYDPRLTLDLPPEMTASTGVNALAHCIEALYSITRHPLSTAAALGGMRCIVRALPRCYAAGGDLDARTDMLIGAHLAGTALASVSMALHHGLCHVLGGTAGVPHGIANAIVLPHAMRFNADAAAWGPQAAEAMSLPADRLHPIAAAQAAAQSVSDLVGQMNLPQRLRDAGVALREADLPRLAELAFQNRAVRNNPKPIADPAQIEVLLRAMW